MKKTTLL